MKFGNLRKKGLIFHCSILFMFCQVVGILTGAGLAEAKSVNDFYFESFVGDYYLSQDLNGVSKMEVVERLTAVFPEYEQNKGICREIPFTNQGGANITLPELRKSDIRVRRNGVLEPIYSLTKYSNYYEVCTGDNDYVLGEQEYEFSYEFERVVTDFGDFQELYWDTNGNGWGQKFEEVVARVHFEDAKSLAGFTGESWCYVGKYGEKGSERCEISKTLDGVSFVAYNLGAGENLTFDVEFKAGTFVVPEVEKNYTLVVILGVTAVIVAVSLISPIRKFLESRKKAKFYEGIFKKPEYQPPKEYSLAEMAEIYLGKKGDVKVGVLLQMIVQGRIALIKKESQIFKTEKWAILVKNLAGARTEELVILAILNGGEEVSEGETITLRTRTGDAMILKLARKFDSTVLADLKRDGLVEKKYKMGSGAAATVTNAVVWIMIGFFVLPFVFAVAEMGIVFEMPGVKMVGSEVFGIIFGALVILAIVLRSVLKKKARKFEGHTEKGLKAARYMDGLKLYISMAEAKRLEFLQSVKGADVSPEGIVKLYEKLLPYAAVFKLEKSWMAELEKYYAHIKDVPEWYQSGVSATDIVLTAQLAAGYARRASAYGTSGGSISGGGGSSSSFSGGGGGGSSGGGGGGGGGGGR